MRWKGAYALRYCPDTTSNLVRLFSDVDIDVQREAVLSIQYHSDAVKHFDAIRQLTMHDNSFVRRWAWTTLSHLSTSNIQQVLEGVYAIGKLHCWLKKPVLMVSTDWVSESIDQCILLQDLLMYRI